jgi:hypothetical protein
VGSAGTSADQKTAQIAQPKQACSLAIPEGSICRISPLVHYWDSNVDCLESPLRAKHGLSAPLDERKYVVFQPDLGGWNNIRMSLEVVVLFALVTGRILVLPPRSILYLLNQNKNWVDNKTGVEDYIDFDRISVGKGVEYISMVDFLRDVAVPGKLLKPFTQGGSLEDIKGKDLWPYFEEACYSRKWQPGKTFLAFNVSTSSVYDSSSQGSQKERLHKMTLPGQDRHMYTYDDAVDTHKAIYFSGSQKNRLLTLFYAYFFFLEPKQDRQYKRFVRDRIRYHEPVYCAGGKIAETMTKRADPSVALPLTSMIRTKYVAFHIRRGDFQHKWVKIPAQEILDLTTSLIPGNPKDKVVYIATDERNMSFFEPFKKAFKEVYFLNDFQFRADYGVQQLPKNHAGMVDQIVCASADIFIGTPLSTFTGYITRLRGYMNTTVPGLYDRTYFYMEKHMHQLQDRPHLHLPFWPREFVDAFEGINVVN